jgi:hypothetical protein
MMSTTDRKFDELPAAGQFAAVTGVSFHDRS